MKKVRGFLLHVGVICSFVCILGKLLDWYNPFMDFTGHVWFAQIALYFVVIALALIKTPHKRTVSAGEGVNRKKQKQKPEIY